MTTSTLYHTQGVRGFHHKKTKREGRTEFYHIASSAKQVRCACCNSQDTAVVPTREQRKIHGVPIGLKKRFWSLKFGAFGAMTAVLLPENVWTFAPART